MVATAFDPYATLGIPAGASREEAARAHRRLAKQFHPDVNPGPAAAERMRRINEAWRILSSPARRSSYDAGRRAPAWPGPGYRSEPSAGSWAGSQSTAGSAYGPRARTAGWTSWPESRPAAQRSRRPLRPEPAEPSFGDRPVVFVAGWLVLGLLYFVGTWLGSLTP